MRVDGGVTAEKYQEVLFKNILSYLKMIFRAMTFMRGNASVHTDDLRRQIFYREGYSVLSWAGRDSTEKSLYDCARHVLLKEWISPFM